MTRGSVAYTRWRTACRWDDVNRWWRPPHALHYDSVSQPYPGCLACGRRSSLRVCSRSRTNVRPYFKRAATIRHAWSGRVICRPVCLVAVELKQLKSGRISWRLRRISWPTARSTFTVGYVYNVNNLILCKVGCLTTFIWLAIWIYVTDSILCIDATLRYAVETEM